ncbi:hypothetical protein ABZ890_12080 [Streptomyces sp. NPDC046984]|uniref:hypothetical protein n=1 Tax=Streptomyces sp. NPDC046984 TaxID=3155138 RepID=UPI0033D61DEE
MPEQLTKPTPTPLAIAHRPAASQHSVTPSFDRHRWEQTLLAVDLPHHSARVLGFGLAHLAGTSGYLAPGTAHADRLGDTFHLTGKQVRLSLRQLEDRGLITRPDIHTWQPQDLVRPVTLTIPTAPARTEPPHSGLVR